MCAQSNVSVVNCLNPSCYGPVIWLFEAQFVVQKSGPRQQDTRVNFMGLSTKGNTVQTDCCRCTYLALIAIIHPPPLFPPPRHMLAQSFHLFSCRPAFTHIAVGFGAGC